MLHCFSGDADFARRPAYLSFAGTVTFKNAGYLRGWSSRRDRPPMRAINASYLIPLTVRAMAEVDLERLCAARANTDAAFGGPSRLDTAVRGDRSVAAL